MPTTVTYYTVPLNLDYLMRSVRVQFGDLDGTKYLDTTVRTALVEAVKFIQHRWSSKYQIFHPDMTAGVIQPVDAPAGYQLAHTLNGDAYIPTGLIEGDIFRNPFIVFESTPPPIIESVDEMAIVLAASYILRKVQTTGSSENFVSWSTQDIRYSTLGAERTQARLLDKDLADLDAYFKKRIAKPITSQFPVISVY